MKMFMIFFVMILSFGINGQDQKVTIDTIITSKIQSKDSIFDKIQYYLATAINDSRSAIELQSKSSHSFLLNPTTDIESSFIGVVTKFTVRFKMEIMIKEGRVRIKTSDHTIILASNYASTVKHNIPVTDDEKISMSGSKKKSEKWKKQIMDTTNTFVSELYKAINVNTSSDW